MSFGARSAVDVPGGQAGWQATHWCAAKDSSFRLVGQFPLFSEDIANVMYKLTLELISYRETGRQLAFLDVGNAEIVNTCTFNVITETTQRDADMCVCVYTFNLATVAIHLRLAQMH